VQKGRDLLQDTGIWDIYASVFDYPSLLVADEIGLFRVLESGPHDTEALLKALKVGRRALEALLPMLASLGLVRKVETQWHNTEDTRLFLLPSSEFYWGGMLSIGKKNTALFRELMNAVEAEVSGLKSSHVLGKSWREGDISSDLASTYAHGIHGQVSSSVTYAAGMDVFQTSFNILDVGAGAGSFSIAIANRNQNAKFTLLDLEPILNISRQYIKNAGLESRVTCHRANMFRDPWPRGFDGVLFSNILHDWSADECKFLLREAHGSLVPGGRIMIHEILMDDDQQGPPAAAAFSLTMLIRTEGKQYSYAEMSEMLVECGFRNPQKQKASGYYYIVTGEKP